MAYVRVACGQFCERWDPRMNAAQALALKHHCRLASETLHPRFRRLIPFGSVIVTVNSGYE